MGYSFAQELVLSVINRKSLDRPMFEIPQGGSDSRSRATASMAASLSTINAACLFYVILELSTIVSFASTRRGNNGDCRDGSIIAHS